MEEASFGTSESDTEERSRWAALSLLELTPANALVVYDTKRGLLYRRFSEGLGRSDKELPAQEVGEGVWKVEKGGGSKGNDKQWIFDLLPKESKSAVIVAPRRGLYLLVGSEFGNAFGEGDVAWVERCAALIALQETS